MTTRRAGTPRPERIEPAEFIVVEGLHSAFVAACFDVTVLLDQAAEVRRDRKVGPADVVVAFAPVPRCAVPVARRRSVNRPDPTAPGTAAEPGKPADEPARAPG